MPPLYINLLQIGANMQLSNVLSHTGNWTQKSSNYSFSKFGTLLLSLRASPAVSLFVLAPISPHPRYSHKNFVLLTPHSSPIAVKKLGVSLSLEEKIWKTLKQAWLYLHFNWKSLYFPNTLLSHNCLLLPEVQSRFGVSFTICINVWHCNGHCLCIVGQCWAICNAFLDSCCKEKRASCWLVWPSTYRGDLSL